ncbi:transporter substrate-binding domain-containing protein [Arthrobacter sp. JCM 19049]|uniref:transporter substrate-binding domain-containing protein n=1 Tax=Arthrobacter sp. JCM 19049 TaxID=1460643 RepID=UPI000A68785D
MTVCSDVPYEPFEFKKDGEIVGLDIDIANEIASDMDLKLSVITAGFDSIESGLFKTQCDIAMSSISITDARKANMDFSEPYLDDDLMLVARKGPGSPMLNPPRASVSPFSRLPPVRNTARNKDWKPSAMKTPVFSSRL